MTKASDITIGVSKGHGPDTNGKRSPALANGRVMREHEFNWATGEYLEAELKRCGFKVVSLSDKNSDTPLSTRKARASAAKIDLYLSIHANASKGVWGDWGGIETYTWPSGESLRIGRIIHAELVSGSELRNRGVKDGSHLYEIKNNSMPVVLVECGFMDSKHDIEFLLKDAYRKECAQEIARGICKAYNVPYVAEATPKPPADTTSDRVKSAVADANRLGVLSDTKYWEDVLEGRVAAKALNILALLENINKKLK